MKHSYSLGQGDAARHDEPTLLTERAGHAAVVGADGRVYAIGGRSSDGTFLSSVEALRPGAKRWSPIAPLSSPRSGLTAGPGIDGRIYALGGEAIGGGWQLVEAYGPVIELSPKSVVVGKKITVIGNNFAANGSVIVYLDTSAATPVAQGETDHDGNFAPLTFTAPSRAGDYTVIAVDDRSHYPVKAIFTAQ